MSNARRTRFRKDDVYRDRTCRVLSWSRPRYCCASELMVQFDHPAVGSCHHKDTTEGDTFGGLGTSREFREEDLQYGRRGLNVITLPAGVSFRPLSVSYSRPYLG